METLPAPSPTPRRRIGDGLPRGGATDRWRHWSRDSAAASGRRASAAVAVLAAVAGASWIVALRQMAGMDMGVATELGSLPSFAIAWVAMMAAMMLPGAVPAVRRSARRGDGAREMAAFVGAYVGVWAAVGLGVFAIYRPHGTIVAGVAVIAAGVYEFTPLKRRARRCCRRDTRSGLEFGLYCLGSSGGLMLALVALGPMSAGWMLAVAVLVLFQKVATPRPAIDVPIAMAIVGLGLLVVLAPATVPGLMPSM